MEMNRVITHQKHSFELSLRQIYAESEYELQNIEITHQVYAS